MKHSTPLAWPSRAPTSRCRLLWRNHLLLLLGRRPSHDGPRRQRCCCGGLPRWTRHRAEAVHLAGGLSQGGRHTCGGRCRGGSSLLRRRGRLAGWHIRGQELLQLPDAPYPGVGPLLAARINGRGAACSTGRRGRERGCWRRMCKWAAQLQGTQPARKTSRKGSSIVRTRRRR